MLERYFIRPETVDRIRNCWLGEEIQTTSPGLPGSRTPHAAWSVACRSSCGSASCPQAWRRTHRGFARPPRCLRAVLPSSSDQSLCFEAYPAAVRSLHAWTNQAVSPRRSGGRLRACDTPLSDWAPGFFEYLREERGLRPTTVDGYSVQLARFEEYIAARRLTPNTLSPAVLDGFLAERRVHVCARSLGSTCAALRAFLRYLFREETIRHDLSAVVDGPRRTASRKSARDQRNDVERTLSTVERRSIVGRRDYAMLMLLVVYGLRAREVAR